MGAISTGTLFLAEHALVCATLLVSCDTFLRHMSSDTGHRRGVCCLRCSALARPVTDSVLSHGFRGRLSWAKLSGDKLFAPNQQLASSAPLAGRALAAAAVNASVPATRPHVLAGFSDSRCESLQQRTQSHHAGLQPSFATRWFLIALYVSKIPAWLPAIRTEK